MNYSDDYGYLSNFAESGGELAAVKQRLDYQAMSGYRTYEGTNGATEVVSATLTYPFGGELTELHATDRYRFGGKELDTHGGLFHYDFDARWYDPIFPQFTTVDPLSEKYPHISPYTYCAANPIMFIDPSGLFEFENIGPNINLPVVAIFPSDRDAALEKDIRAARDAKVPIVIVDDSADFQEALDVMANQGTSTDVYVFNSHGKDGKFSVGESVINEKNAENFGKTFEEEFNGKTVVISACNVAETEKGESVIEKISGASNSTVIGSSHLVPAGYKYDGSRQLNQNTSIWQATSTYNMFKIATNGRKSGVVYSVSIDKLTGVSWFPHKHYLLNAH